jgi:hypothetical protein
MRVPSFGGVGAAGVAAAVLCAAVPGRAEERVAAFEAAAAQFEMGQRGDAGANVRAHDAFEELVRGDPGNPAYLAYYGSALTIRGRDAWAPWKKVKHTERGLELIDRAVAMLRPEHDRATLRGVPVSVEALVVAGYTFLAVPDMFHRFEAAKAVVRQAFANPALGASPAHVRARFHHQAAMVARREGRPAEEVAALTSALSLWPDAPFAGDLRARLSEVRR